MTKEQRKGVYDELVAQGRLSQDDGALVKEFGAPKDYVDKQNPDYKLPDDAKEKEVVDEEQGKIKKAAAEEKAAKKKVKEKKEELKLAKAEAAGAKK